MALVVTVALGNCTRNYDCDDLPIRPAFIGFAPADINTLVLRRFKAGTAYQTLLDTLVVKRGTTGFYQTSHDTTVVFLQDYQREMRANYDWQLVVLATRRVVRITTIVGERNTGTCGRGIFSMDPIDCQCQNQLFSARVDNQLVDFSNTHPGNYRIFIN